MPTHFNQALSKLKQKKPLVLHLTNYVTMDLLANTLLALGAAPLMTESSSELEELIQLSSSIVLNLGTLTQPFIERCLVAATLSKKLTKPIILDPVGAGATVLRTKASRELLPYASIVKGNASEILALNENTSHSKGVESVDSVNSAKAAAINLANDNHCVVVITGKQDFVTDGVKQQTLSGGSPLMTKVTGMGCALGGVIAAFHSIIEDPFEASCIAVNFLNTCSELAASTSDGPGSLRATLLDSIYTVH